MPVIYQTPPEVLKPYFKPVQYEGLLRHPLTSFRRSDRNPEIVCRIYVPYKWTLLIVAGSPVEKPTGTDWTLLGYYIPHYGKGSPPTLRSVTLSKLRQDPNLRLIRLDRRYSNKPLKETPEYRAYKRRSLRIR